jgi:glycine betaine/proline transport system ATP-binding protein
MDMGSVTSPQSLRPSYAAPDAAKTLEREQAMIECRGVWKIFGSRARETIDAMRQGKLDKNSALEKFGCSVGVADVDLTVNAGEIFCIMGLSGSGKSTLLRHINRLIEPTAGEIIVDGERVDLKSPSELRALRNKKIGMVFQHIALLPHRTVLDNAAFGLEARGVPKKERRSRAAEKLALVGLEEWADRRPEELSGGMQQRVGLARALTSDPGILLMDEPFSALDPIIRRDLQNQFLSLTKIMRKTTVFITHDLEEAMKLGTRVAIMRDARIVQVGTPEEIITHPANEYVTDFVRGISKQSILKASNVMRPVEQFVLSGRSLPDFAAVASPDDRLSDLIAKVASNPGPIAVKDDGNLVGIVSLSGLLTALKSSDHPGGNC